jgi:glycosyltransferase involved in cell wall biosynthesis
MNILQVIPYFTPKRGGDVNVCYNLSKYLAESSHEVTIITTDFEFDAEYAKTLDEAGVRVIPFHCIVNIKLFLTSPSMKKWLKRNITNFDVVHMHDYRSYQNVIVYHYAKKYGVPYVLQSHGSVLPFFQKQRLKKLYDLVWGYKILKDATKVIALTMTEAEQYKKMGVNENKIEIVPNGIDLSEYDNLPKRGEFRRKYSIKDEEKIVLFVGRLHKTKGIELLVKAFADLSKELNHIKLVLLGPDDGYQSMLERIIRDLKIDTKVVFTGFVTNEEKMAAFVDADVFVTPSFLGFPVTFLEACACGTPIITTNKGDELNWIHDAVGYVVEYDKDKLRDAILIILSDKKIKNRFGEEGKRLVMKKFGWDNVIKQIEDTYLTVSGGS